MEMKFYGTKNSNGGNLCILLPYNLLKLFHAVADVTFSVSRQICKKKSTAVEFHSRVLS